jgi:hypothetical protein
LKIKLEFKVLNLFQFGIELCSISANLFQLSDFLVLLSFSCFHSTYESVITAKS